MKKLTAVQQRFFDNVVLVAALGLIFDSLKQFGVPLYSLGEVANTTSGGTPDRSVSEFYDGNIPWIKSGELNDGLIEESEEYITDLGLQNSSAKVYPKGTLVIALYGATVGKTGILGLNAASNQAVCAITPTTNRISTSFLFWFFRYKRPDFLKNSFGAAQPNISQRVLRESLLPVPPVVLQREICNFLDIVEQRQKGKKNLLLPHLPSSLSDIGDIVAHIEELATSLEEARGLRRKAEEEAETIYSSTAVSLMKSLPNQEFVPIENIAEVRGGIQKGPHRLAGNNPVRYLTVAHVHRNKILLSDPRFFEVNPRELERWALKSGDVLIIEGNGSTDQIGRTALFRGEIDKCVHQNHVIRIRPNQEYIDPEYLNLYLNSPVGQEEVQSRSRTTSGLRNLSVGRIKSISILLPPLSEQRHIVTYLDNLQAKVDTLKQLQAETQAELDALLPSILDKAFKGELV